MRYKAFQTGDYWCVAAQLGEHTWRVVERAFDEEHARQILDRLGRKKAS